MKTHDTLSPVTGESSPSVREFTQGWTALLFATLGAGVGFSCLGYILGTLVVPLQDEFGWGRGQITLTSLVSSLGMAAALPFMGPLLDRFGVKRVAWVSLPLFALVLFALSRFDATLLWFLALYALAGIIGVGTSAVTYTKAIVERFRVRRGLALGIMAMGLGAAGLLLPPLMGVVVAAYGWRGAYLTMALLALSPVLVLPFARLANPGKARTAAGQAAAPATTPEPAGPSRGQVLRGKEFWLLCAAFFFLGWALLTMVPHFVPMLIDSGVDPVLAATLSSLVGVGTLIGRPIVGWLLDRFYPTLVAVPLFFVAAAGCLGLLWGGAAFAPVTAVLIGLGFGAEIDLMSYLSSRYFGQRAFGALYSYVYSAFMVVSAIGPVTAGYLFDAQGSYSASLVVAAGFLVLGSVLLVVLPRYDRREAIPAGESAVKRPVKR
ncbi:MFS transporter [Saxibacter everestensis]|uniref:MFS transporter n=1 Tax=Saxibacter everestensis TaxID=2909229 RepID=A0ABY8QU43_9MICO|nr:MFS transporter [Brevibacteriaceae bacterium ZFBP1038]